MLKLCCITENSLYDLEKSTSCEVNKLICSVKYVELSVLVKM